jgi:hypothetical protein
MIKTDDTLKYGLICWRDVCVYVAVRGMSWSCRVGCRFNLCSVTRQKAPRFCIYVVLDVGCTCRDLVTWMECH